MNRREFVGAGAAALTATGVAKPAEKMTRKNNIKQSVCRWCYAKTPIEDLCRNAAAIGIQAIDLLDPKEWPVAQKYGLTLTVTPGPTTIPDGFNRRENHDAIVEKFKDQLAAAKAANAPSIIVFSGNRKGMSDAEGADNCVIGLNRIKKMAEDANILVVMELLNSKVNHKDYMCDHTAWGVDVIKRVDSPHIKLLYDIYHMQIMEGDVIRTIKENHQYIGHYHTGGNPGRNEIDSSQELNYAAITRAIIDTGFKGHMAHEFIPLRDPMKSLAEAVELCDV
jgi:hydroxypyruvate isomerase